MYADQDAVGIEYMEYIPDTKTKTPYAKTFVDTRTDGGLWTVEKDFHIQNLNNEDASTIFSYDGNHPFHEVPPGIQVQVGIGAKPNLTYGESIYGGHHAVLDIFGNTHLRSGVIDWYGRKTAPSLGSNEIPVLTAYPDTDGNKVQWTGINSYQTTGACSSLTAYDYNNSRVLTSNIGNFSVNYQNKGGYLTGSVPTTDAIYDTILGSNLIEETYFIEGRGAPSNPIWISQDAPYYANGQVWSASDYCFVVHDSSWVNANVHTAPDADVAGDGNGWTEVDCPCDKAPNTFAEFKSITGLGVIDSTEQTIDGAPYITITCDYNPIEIDLCSGGTNITIEVLGRRVS